MGVPESLIALGILVVAAILLGGLRRMRNARRDAVRMADRMNQGVARDELDSDFPSGSARVTPRHGERDESFLRDTDVATENKRRTPDLDQAVPILVDVREDYSQRIEPELGLDEEDEDVYVEHDVASVADNNIAVQSAPLVRGVKNASPVFDTGTAPLGAGESEILGEPRVKERPADKPVPRREPIVQKPSKPVLQARKERDEAQHTEAREPTTQRLPLDDDLIIIGVMARDRNGFNGTALLDLFLERGLRYGHYSLFHHYTGEEKENESLFSVANIVNPGTFDLSKISELQTPGITMFLSVSQVNGKAKAIDVYDYMLETARAIAHRLNGELRDQNRSVMTNQTIEHDRQRIRQLEMQSLLYAR